MEKKYSETKISIVPYGSSYAYNFEDALDIPLEYPYSREEWDIIFSKYINLLTHKERWLRLAAISRLRTALECEQMQYANCAHYKPRTIEERINAIFQNISPLIFEDFYNEFKSLKDIKPYRALLNQRLNQIMDNINQSSDDLDKIQNHEFEISVAHINGYLDGVSRLCGGLNYVPIYQAIICPQIYNQITKNIETGILEHYSKYRFSNILRYQYYSAIRLKSACRCTNFETVYNWESIWDELIDKWITKRLFGGNYQVTNESYLSQAKNHYKWMLIYLIKKALNKDNLIVWKFTIGEGYDLLVGFDNESYAFKSDSKLFLITFGWLD